MIEKHWGIWVNILKGAGKGGRNRNKLKAVKPDRIYVYNRSHRKKRKGECNER